MRKRTEYAVERTRPACTRRTDGDADRDARGTAPCQRNKKYEHGSNNNINMT